MRATSYQELTGKPHNLKVLLHSGQSLSRNENFFSTSTNLPKNRD